MTRRGGRVSLWAAWLAFAAAPAAAQVQTGEIFGRVTDMTGAVLPGVTVTVTSSALQGVQTAVTTETGAYRFPRLPIGVYVVTFDLQGFKRLVREGIQLTSGFNAEINARLEISAVEETITVSGESPVVDTKEVRTGGTFSRDVLENIPSARDPWVILQMTPGVVMSGVNVGGNRSGQQLGYSAFGGGQGNSMWNVDGATITDMAATGASPVYYDFDSFEEIQITTGGSDASLQTGGVNINLVTKSGSNVFKGSGRLYVVDADMQAENVTRTLFDQGAQSGNPIKNIKDYGAELGGPIVKDRLWFWGGYGKQDIRVGVLGFYKAVAECSPPPSTFDQLEAIKACLETDLTVLENYNAKVQGQASAAHRLNFLFTRGDKIRNARDASRTRPPETTYRQVGPVNLYKLTHNWVLTDRLALETMAQYTGGGFSLLFHEDALATVQRRYDRGTGMWSRSYSDYHTKRPTTEVKADGNYFLSNVWGGDHSVKFGVRWRNTPFQSRSHIGGNATARYRFDVPEYADVHRDSVNKNGLWVLSAYVSDSYNKGRVRLTLGLRYDFQDDTLKPATVPENPIVPWLLPAVEFQGADAGVTYSDWSPRVSLTYDLRGDGKTVAKASFARYFGQGLYVSDNLNPITGVTLQYNWRDPNGDGFVQANELIDRFGVPCVVNQPCTPRTISGNYVLAAPGSPTTANTVDPNLKNDRTDEVIVGIDRELMPNFGVGVSYIYRRYDQFQRSPRVGLSRDDFVQKTYTEPDPRFPNTPTATYYDLRPGFTLPPNVFHTRNYDFLRTYHGLELTARKRMSDRWQLFGSYSVNRTRQQYGADAYEDPTNIEFLDGYEGGPNDTRWLVKLGGGYALPFGINVSAFFNGRDGFLYNDVVNVPQRSGGLGGVNAMVTPQGKTRYADVWMLDAHVEKWVAIRRARVIVSLDVFNVGNVNTVTSQGTTINSVNYKRPSVIIAPRVLRLGVRYTF